jgi:hypothetical protein
VRTSTGLIIEYWTLLSVGRKAIKQHRLPMLIATESPAIQALTLQNGHWRWLRTFNVFVFGTAFCEFDPHQIKLRRYA